MPTVQDVLAVKGTMVHSIAPSATVLEATQKMNTHKLGALLVMDDGHVAGIFTERDHHVSCAPLSGAAAAGIEASDLTFVFRAQQISSGI